MTEQAAPPVSAAPKPGKASKGMRALAVLAALVLAFAAAVMILAASDINSTPTLKECAAGATPKDGKCFDGGSTKQTITVALMFISGGIGALAVLLALFVAATGRMGRLLLQLSAAAIVFGVVGVGIGSI